MLFHWDVGCLLLFSAKMIPNCFRNAEIWILGRTIHDCFFFCRGKPDAWRTTPRKNEESMAFRKQNMKILGVGQDFAEYCTSKKNK